MGYRVYRWYGVDGYIGSRIEIDGGANMDI